MRAGAGSGLHGGRVAPDQSLQAAVAALSVALREVGAPHMLIGGLAVILRGIARQTNDVDATLWAEGVDIELLLEGFARHGIVARIPDAAQFARQNQVLLLRHEASRTPMEVSLAWLPFEATALHRAELLDVGGVRVPVALVDDLIIYKAVAWRDRDRADIERLLAAHGDHVDLTYIRQTVAQFADLLEEPGRVSDLERIIERTEIKRRPGA
jgi:hypothetical protein